MESIDLTTLPNEVKDKLAQLQLELSEGERSDSRSRFKPETKKFLVTGDITEKGYQKKRAQILAPFQTHLQAGGDSSN